MATLFDFAAARAGFDTSTSTPPGSLEKLFVNRLSSIVSNIVRREGSSEIDNFRAQYLLSEISTKSPFSNVSNTKEERGNLAIAKTKASNDHCRRFNEDPHLDFANWAVLRRARKIIQEILGNFNYGIYDQSGFSGGASTCHKRGRSEPFAKYGSLDGGCVEVTPRAATRLAALVENTPSMHRLYQRSLMCGHDSIQLTLRDVVSTVEKNSKIDRTILKQPPGNNILQKAIGKAIRRKLKAVGIDLGNQGLNQELARVGSIYRSHATIDLSSASDTVNMRIVWELLPPDWYAELFALRCDRGVVLKKQNGREIVCDEIEWHMFSAMGNAYTFELESLIFYALAVATADEMGPSVGFISVYGDDIIVPNSIATAVCETLTRCGFLVNDKKTHIDGWFRESCGAHWYKGVDVSPFYIRTGLTELSSIMRLANQLRKWSSDGIVCDPRFLPLWNLVANEVPAFLWGGWDLERSDSLVSPHSPRKRLVAVTSRAQLGGDGALAASFQAVRDLSFSQEMSQLCFVEKISNLSEVGNCDWVKTSENLFWIRRNRVYGRYTSPPTWIVYSPSHGKGGNTGAYAEHLLI